MVDMWWVFLGAGGGVGAAVTGIVMRSRAQAAARAAHAEREGLATELTAARQRVAVLEDVGSRLRETFQALSAEALRSNNSAFLDLAQEKLATFQVQAAADLEARQRAIDQQIAPVGAALSSVDAVLREIERDRVGAYAALRQQVDGLTAAQTALRQETATLAGALRSPSTRGRWGELALRRVVEAAGMVAHCDFVEQETSADGRWRADLVVRLPGDGFIVVDAKAPLTAYMDAIAAGDEAARAEHLRRYARHVRDRVEDLARKEYVEAFRPSPGFVVMFLPGEAFFTTALQHDPQLLEFAFERQVLLTGPMSLIALLKTAAVLWRQEQVAEGAEAISSLGRDLYERISTWTRNLSHLGRDLERAVGSYNASVGSLEGRVLPKAREFRDLGIESRKEIPELSVIDVGVREMREPAPVPDLTRSRIG